MSDDMKAEIGDTVEYGIAVRRLDGSVSSEAPRGIVTRTFKNGDIEIRSQRSGDKQKLHPEEFTVLSKGD